MGGMDNIIGGAGISGEAEAASQAGNTQAPVDEADQAANDMQGQVINQYDRRRVTGTAPSSRRRGGKKKRV